MELDLTGKKALITGASRGIGLSIAKALYAEGCTVVLNARNTDQLDAAAKEMPGAVGIARDVTVAAQAEYLVQETTRALGGLDILVCNVGSGRSVAPGQETPDEWQRIFALNLWSTTNVVEAARDALIASRGSVVCISSICGFEVVPNAPVTYSAAKAALHAYVRGISRPLGTQGVRINAIAPGNILFDGSVWDKKLQTDAESVQAMLASNVALSRLGRPQEIADLAVYLASSRSGFATGAVWTLDGGQVRA